MKELADQLHSRAIAGEDFNKLQAEAYKIAGIDAPANSSLGKIRRISLPPSQAWIMDLKPGEVSSVIDAPNAYFIYKIKTKEMLPLDQAREEIKGSLRSRTHTRRTRSESKNQQLPPSTKSTLIGHAGHKSQPKRRNDLHFADPSAAVTIDVEYGNVRLAFRTHMRFALVQSPALLS